MAATQGPLTVGFLGAGQMATAIVQGVLRAGLVYVRRGHACTAGLTCNR
jgi:pyrroline-5-carboxylate reductase